MPDQKYTGIFRNGYEFCITDINKRSFSLGQKQIIKVLNGESIQTHIDDNLVAINIQKVLHHNDKQLFLITYLYHKGIYSSNWYCTDLVIKDRYGLRHDITLKEIPYRDYHLSLAKIINDTLFFAFTDSQEILYAMELDNGKYEVKQYRHQIGIIQNIWLKEQENEEYVFTSERNKETISGIFKIIGQDSIEMAEIFDYKVAGYNTLDGTFVYCNPDSTLSYRNGNDPVGISIKEFMGNGETIYDIFFLEDGSFIIESTKTGPHHFANLLFGSGNLIHYFYYYHMKEDRHGNLKIKKIRTFGSHWKLEQLIFRGSGHE